MCGSVKHGILVSVRGRGVVAPWFTLARESELVFCSSDAAHGDKLSPSYMVYIL